MARRAKKRQPLKFLTRFKKRLESNFDKLKDRIEQALGGAQAPDTAIQKQPIQDREDVWVATEKQHRRAQNAQLKWYSMQGPLQYAQDSANSVLSIQRLVQRQFGKKPPTPEEMAALRSGAAGVPAPFVSGVNPITAKIAGPSFIASFETMRPELERIWQRVQAGRKMGSTWSGSEYWEDVNAKMIDKYGALPGQTKLQANSIAAPEKPKKIGPGAPMKDLLFAGEATYDRNATTYNENFTRDTSMLPGWSGKKRQFSQLARNLGHFNLALGSSDKQFNRYSEIAARGTNIPEEFLSEEQVMNGMREQAGISIGGGTWLDEKSRTIRKGVRKAYRWAQMAHFAKQGGAVGSMAMASLANEIIGGAEEKLMDTALRKTWEPAAASMLSSASKALGGGAIDVKFIERMVHGAGRALRLGNAGVILGQIGLGAYDHYQQTQDTYRASVQEGQGLVINTNFQRYAAQIKDTSRFLYEKSITGYSRAMNLTGFGESETTINADAAQRLKAAEMMASNPLAMGIHFADKYSAYAAKKGKLVQNLSDYEKAEAIEPTIKEAKWNAGQDANLQSMAWDAAWNKNNDIFGIFNSIEHGLRASSFGDFKTDQVKADYLIALERLKGERITGTGEFQNLMLGEFAFAKMRLERYKKHVQNVPEETKKLLWRTQQEREMEVEGQRKRRKVQNFD